MLSIGSFPTRICQGVSRRSFLTASAGLVAAAACGGKSGTKVAGPTSPTTAPTGAAAVAKQPSEGGLLAPENDSILKAGLQVARDQLSKR